MRTARNWVGAAALIAPLFLSYQPGALAQKASTDERLRRLERVFNSGTMVELLERVNGLQREVQELRGELELQTHTLSQIKERQRELYLDVDRRLRRMETGGGTASPPSEPPPTDAPSTSSKTPKAAGSATPTSTPEPAGADSVEEQKSYQQALNLLKEGRYEEAIKGFQTFVRKYPRSSYTDNARYWLGEAYYVTRQFEPAIQTFQTLLTEHPNSPKLTHALLKIGFSHHELGQKDAAQRVLKDLMAQYPNTTAAQLAGERLQQLRSN